MFRYSSFAFIHNRRSVMRMCFESVMVFFLLACCVSHDSCHCSDSYQTTVTSPNACWGVRHSPHPPNILSMSRLSQMALGHPLHSPPVSFFHRALCSLSLFACYTPLYFQTEWPWCSELGNPTQH